MQIPFLLRHHSCPLHYPPCSIEQLQGHRGNAVGLRVRLRNPLTHEIEESKLARAGAKLIYEAAGKVRAEDGAEVVIRDLSCC